MKVHGTSAPAGAFSIESSPGRPGYSLLRLYQNAHEVTEEREGETLTGWEWDEYHVEVPSWGGLAQNVADNYGVFLEQGVRSEIDMSNAALYERSEAARAAQEDADGLLVDQEFRLTLLELGV